MAGYGTAALRGEPNRLGLGDEIANRQNETISADQDTAAGTFDAQRPGGESVLRNLCPQADDRAQCAVQIKGAIPGLRLDLARYLPIHGSRHFSDSLVATVQI